MANATQDNAAIAATRAINEGAGNVTSTTTATGASATQQLLDPSLVSIEVLTLHGATPVISLPAPRVGSKKTVYLVQDATGSRIPSYATLGGGAVKWVGAAAPTLQTAAGGTDKITFESFDGTNWVGTPALHIA